MKQWTRRRTASLMACIGISMALCSLPGGPVAASARRPAAAGAPAEQLLNCLRHPVTEPARFVITCADANEQLVDMHWQSWSVGAATATATYVVNTCTPSCAAGTFARHPALVVLGGALETNLGVLYTQLSWHYLVGKKVEHETFSLLPLPERLVTCEKTTVVRPARFVVACADANAELTSIAWQSWGPGAATATATYVENTCTPSCAAGAFVRYPAQVELTGARFSSEGALVYSTLHWQYQAKGVTHREVFSLLS